MNERSHTLGYLMDTRQVRIKSNITVRVDSVMLNPELMPKQTTVIRDKSMYLPLVLFHYWKSENTCTLGQSSFLEPLSTFVKGSLIDEINRSGHIHADSTSQTDYTLTLSIDAVKAQGTYKSEGFFYFAFVVYGFTYYDIAGPATANLSISYQLRKNGQLVYNGNHYAIQESERLTKNTASASKQQTNYAASMVEATSLNIKHINQLIVNDLNNYFRQSPLP